MVLQLDGTVNEWGWCKQKLEVNAILAVSLAVRKAGASVHKNLPLQGARDSSCWSFHFQRGHEDGSGSISSFEGGL
ncbi:enolase-like isoform X2 [Cornus florida]|uniref:enolase-like isoform X2 n=1 Tax=Cornus florida TaxID=4283 RepID=UPI0028983A81|nr:enolase-like isoform X2 [Cornus florida]